MASRRSSRKSRQVSGSSTSRGDVDKSPGSRRAGASRRRRGGGNEGSGAASHRPAVGRDGKANIACPNCATRYKIAEENLESQVTCGQCQRTFYPLAAAGSRRKPADNSKPILYGIGALAVMVVIGLIVNSLSQPAPRKNRAIAQEPEPIKLGNSTREVRSVMEWATAIANKDSLNARMYTDLDAVQKLLGIETETRYSTTFGSNPCSCSNVRVWRLLLHRGLW